VSAWELARHREYVLYVARAGDETTRETDEEAAEVRRAQGSTVAALNAFSADVASEVRVDAWEEERQRRRQELGFADPDDAIQALAAEVGKGTLRVPRLLVLDSLVKLASRRGDELRTREAALDTLLEALVRQARGPEAGVGDAVHTVRGALESVASLSGVASAPHPWMIFVQRAGDALGLTQAEIDKPLCNDAETVKKGNLEAVGVTVEFHTDASPGALRHFCDPKRWHECSAYQKKMTPLTGAGAIAQPGPGPHGWRRDLLERVQLSPAKELKTPLRFTYGIEDQNDPDWVHLDYLLLEGTQTDITQTDILVDEGALDVRRVTSGKHRGRTRVSAKKAILFADPLLAKWPTVACDTFWMDLVIDAAVGCLGPGTTIDSTEGKPMMAESKDARLDKTIDEAAAAAEKSIETYRELAKKGVAQLAGDSPADTDKWVDLTSKVWAQAARDAAQAWTTYNAVLQAFAESGESKAEQPGPGETENDT
jgi:hypothetical protein